MVQDEALPTMSECNKARRVDYTSGSESNAMSGNFEQSDGFGATFPLANAPEAYARIASGPAWQIVIAVPRH